MQREKYASKQFFPFLHSVASTNFGRLYIRDEKSNEDLKDCKLFGEISYKLIKFAGSSGAEYKLARIKWKIFWNKQVFCRAYKQPSWLGEAIKRPEEFADR